MDKKTSGPRDGEFLSAFDIEDPNLPDWIAEEALSSGGYPYDKRMKQKHYARELKALQYELLKLQYWMREKSERLVVIFEGRDAAGKGSTIKRFMQYLNPRHAHVVALAAPTQTERGQWYFQRYIARLPTAGDMSFFDRSWYNRAGVEPVMGFCTPEQTEKFLAEVPAFEKSLVRDGLHLVKFWLAVGREMQLKRFHDRRHDPLKRWKLSPVDLKSTSKWGEYTAARNKLFDSTHIDEAPWTVVRSNDKRRARINALRYVLSKFDYDGKEDKVVNKVDAKIVGSDDEFFKNA